MKYHKIIIIILLFILIVFSLYSTFLFFNAPLNRREIPKTFTIDHGENIELISKSLKKEELIRSDLFFTMLVRVSGKARVIKAGQYVIYRNMKNTDILNIFTKGIVATVKFTIPEGFRMEKIAELLEKEGIAEAKDFINACKNEELLKKHNIPFNNAEGFLFPDTYIVAKDLTAIQIADIMINKFYDKLKSINNIDYTINSLKKIVIIASIVEKEAKIDSERAIIAAVFYNRLKKGKRLESCSTVQYVLGESKNRLLFSDLKVDSPYNTYIHSGLPPGPISNPGIKSLIAAIHPADVDYLFFISKGDGSHYFSSTYKQHIKAIQKYNKSRGISHQLS